MGCWPCGVAGAEAACGSGGQGEQEVAALHGIDFLEGGLSGHRAAAPPAEAVQSVSLAVDRGAGERLEPSLSAVCLRHGGDSVACCQGEGRGGRDDPLSVGWLTGFEPATSWTTTRRSAD